MSKEEILAAIRACAAKLKRNPRLADLRRMSGINWWHIKACFGGLDSALSAAGLEPRGPGFKPPPGRLLLDWAAVARKQKKLPSKTDYRRDGRHSPGAFASFFGSWLNVPRAFLRFAREEGLESKWKDVVAMILKKEPDRKAETERTLRPALHGNLKLDRRKVRFDRPIYGPPLPLPGVAHEPVNEAGVIYIFGAVAHKLGFVMQRMQLDFPDCEAMREVGPGSWQRVRIEFEFKSRDFLRHRHRRDGCDLIVCWIHDWPDCPRSLEVIELRKIVRGL